MGLTLTAITGAHYVSGNKRVRVYDATFDSSYPTGGESLTAADVGLKHLDAVIPHGLAADSDGSGGTFGVGVTYDHTNAKLQAWESAGDGDSLDEVGSTNSLANYTVRLDCRGY